MPKEALIRFVLAPDGTVAPDLKERLPGRGVWLTGARGTVEQAVRKGVFARAFKANAKPDASLADLVDALLVRDALQAFAIGIKAGGVVFGFAKIEEALKRRKVAALVHASDGAPDGKRKLDAAFTRERGLFADPVGVFTAAELGLASGRTNVIHAALIEGGASARFLERAARVARYRGGIRSPASDPASNTED
jgi:predicted RNA-binding protein YlxR (DUF448 family)